MSEKEIGRQLCRDTPATYRIRLQGSLGESWSEYLNSMTITPERASDGSPVTVLTGRLVDQAALFGVLNNAYDMGFPLLSVECLERGKE